MSSNSNQQASPPAGTAAVAESAAFQRFDAFTDVQVRAALLLVQGKSAAATARALEINRSTVFAWKADPEFARLLADMRTALVERAWSTLIAARVHAAHTVVKLLDSKDAAVALRAAQSILNLDHKQGCL